MQITYAVKDAGGLRMSITRVKVQHLFAGEGGRQSVRRTTVDQAEVVVMDHAVLSDDGEAFRTGGVAATPEQIIKALQDDVFRPAWARVSEVDEAA